ncbi:alkaline phosphatase [Actinocatenispora thailandica]|uniref:Alkaline phosphatase n=1 Tax=Actinocatenispora thailandica TaxID=227318 RepID=A0A7R7DSZ8_9ACTN|nr:alkaline phosphatase D family protein [Actinocatenispora thailandica]BCJ37242.1 alkaline phosphatase [Actinocatenispora thailandica]
MTFSGEISRRLVLGPVLRCATDDTASIWVETDSPARVEVRAGDVSAHADTFTAFGHHYALVVASGLGPGADLPYSVRLDGERVWPPRRGEYPPSRLRTRGGPPATVRVMFGSCREASPYTDDGFPPDALDTFARTLARGDAAVPDLLLLLGDQVYADEISADTQRYLRDRREHGDGPSDAPTDQAADFEEYTRLYHESWTDPEIRWLLSTVPSAMIFDDHEIVDDWNTSAAWRARIHATTWWRRRIVGGLASYWVYQQLGNLTPDQLASDETAREVLTGGDASAALARLAIVSDRATDPATPTVGPSWSYRIDLARTRVLVLDNRSGRVLTPGRRQMLSPTDWDWLTEQVRGDYDHLIVGASLPWLLPPAIHDLETADEKLADSPRALVAAGAERVRQVADMEHWAAFRDSFERFGELLRDVSAGRCTPRPPASISVLSGDVHHSYVAAADLGPDQRSRVYQLTCSPTHNQAPPEMKIGFRIGWSRAAAGIAAGIARLARVPRPGPRWRKLAGPYFSNAVGTLELRARSARVRLDGTARDAAGRPVLQPLAQVPLAWRGGGQAVRRIRPA